MKPSRKEKKATILELRLRMEMAESQPMLPVFSGCNSCATFTILEDRKTDINL